MHWSPLSNSRTFSSSSKETPYSLVVPIIPPSRPSSWRLHHMTFSPAQYERSLSTSLPVLVMSLLHPCFCYSHVCRREVACHCGITFDLFFLNDFEHHFMYVLVVGVYLEKCPLKNFGLFKKIVLFRYVILISRKVYISVAFTELCNCNHSPF